MFKEGTNKLPPGLNSDKGEKVRILYIGKSKEVIDQLKAHEGLALIHKESAQDAIRHLTSADHPDAIICELYIPGCTAFEFLQSIREHPDLHRIIFILVSWEFREDIFKAAISSNVDDYYVIPLPEAGKLLSRIRFLKVYRSKKSQSAESETSEERLRIPRSKRIFDLVFASVALILLAPFLLLVMIAIRFETKGKVYYSSRRVGRELFNFYKLRSMHHGSDSELNKLAQEKNKYATEELPRMVDYAKPCPYCSELPAETTCSPLLHIGPNQICEYWYHHQKAEIAKAASSFIKIGNDPRITRVGKVIRNLSIDELPQLINVIKGDMSLVGNRPLPVYEAEKLTTDEMALRFLAPAGLTGLWQVELRGKAGKMSAKERMLLDNQYADLFVENKYSLWYDLKLILRTIPAIFQKETS
jgi:lipopolysaccharide/colanic/teichoic acid biosynthesis glycosyltransferase